MSNRRPHVAGCKVRMALQAVKGERTVFGMAAEYGADAACARGGARCDGVCPQQKIQVMRIGPPQQGHGARGALARRIAFIEQRRRTRCQKVRHATIGHADGRGACCR